MPLGLAGGCDAETLRLGQERWPPQLHLRLREISAPAASQSGLWFLGRQYEVEVFVALFPRSRCLHPEDNAPTSTSVRPKDAWLTKARRMRTLSPTVTGIGEGGWGGLL